MRIKTLLLAIATIVALPTFAVKGIEDGSKYGTGEDSIRCLENLSLYTNYYKIKNYDLAYDSWKIVYDECPTAAGRTLYSQGAYLITYKMAKETDPAKKQEWFKELMKCYDQRVKYFGKDKKYPEAWVRGRQAIDYITYSPEKDYLQAALPWLEQAVNYGKHNADNDVIQKYFELLEVRYQTDKAKYSESFINDYIALGDMVDKRIAMGDKYKEAYIITRNNLNALFINSGAADCATLEGVFSTKVEENKLNDAELEKIINIFDKADCKESEIYFTASSYAHALNPVAKTAVGCARQAFKKEDYNKAISFYNEAIALEEVDTLKYTYAIEKANTLYIAKRYSEAKSAALQAISFDSRQGEPYMLLATIYVTVDPYPEDPILNKTKYWVAVDKLQTAKSIEPELAEKANTLINSYRKFYPTKEEVFFKPELAPGASFTVGGLINESVRCRD